ncbi:MAG: serine/threonine-protein kinase [Myxococcota bacterium]|nr:serine/threonine-protein kinase [Myxococcota bacterium]
MNTGEIIRDGNGQNYEIGSLLGRGLWAKSYSARSEDGLEWILKVPFTPKDLPTGKEHLAEISRKIVIEMGEILHKNKSLDLLSPKNRFTTQDGSPCLLYYRNDNTLARKLAQGIGIQELLAICINVVHALDSLPISLPVHGNLHPRNIFLSERGRVQLADPITPSLAENYAELYQARNRKSAYFPPELREQKISSPRKRVIDTYCIAAILFRGVVNNSRIGIPEKGLDKKMRTLIQETVQNRLKDSGTNHLFHSRLANKLSQFLNRALSENSKPSPPFRFDRLSDFSARLQNLYDLIDPTVTHVGKILLSLPPGESSFQTDETVRFSCTIECAPKMENFEEILCGIRLSDRTRNERIKGYPCDYTVVSHPTGRLRFEFSLGPLPAAKYSINIAFKIRESTSEPRTAQCDFDIEPAPGWIPEKREPKTPPIILHPDKTRVPSIIEDEDEFSSDLTEEMSYEKPTPPTLLIDHEVESHSEESNLDPESFFPSEEVSDPNWNPTNNSPKTPPIVVVPISPAPEPSSHFESIDDSHEFPSVPMPQAEPPHAEEGSEEELSDSQDPAESNPFGTSWEIHPPESQPYESEVSEPSSEESETTPTILANLKDILTNIFSDAFSMFVFVAVIVVIFIVILLIS